MKIKTKILYLVLTYFSISCLEKSLRVSVLCSLKKPTLTYPIASATPSNIKAYQIASPQKSSKKPKKQFRTSLKTIQIL